MAYTRIRNDSPASDEKVDSDSSLSSIKSQVFQYKPLFIISLVLWISTSVALGWALLRTPYLHGNHAATSLPFRPGMCENHRKAAPTPLR
jgi:hypothetical protein